MNKKFIVGMALSASLLSACSGNQNERSGKFTVNSTAIV